MSTSGIWDCQWTPRSILKDFTEDGLTIPVGSLFKNGTALMATAGTTRQLVELIGVAAQPFAGWVRDSGLHGEFQKPMVDFEHGYQITTDSPVCKREQSKLLESASCGTCQSLFTNFRAYFSTFFSASASQDRTAWDAGIAYSKSGRIKILYKGRKMLGVRAAMHRFR